MCLALVVAACGPSRSSARGAAAPAQSAEELAASVERLRIERRLRERKIRDLERQLAAASVASDEASSVPGLPVQVLAPSGDEHARSLVEPGPSRAAAGDGELPGQLTADGERVIGLADDGSEIVYVEDAAAGRLVQPSAEALAEVGRTQRRSAAPLADGPAIDEGDAAQLLDDASAERIAAYPGPLASIGRRAARSRTAGRLAPPVRGPDNGDAEAQYRSAVAQVRQGEYGAAVGSFRAFLRRYPSHDYSDNAQYWLGEAFYAQRLYPQALVELRLVAERYPQGNKVPDALLKVGYCHLAMGERAQAQRVLHELVRLYPRTQPAILAARKLEERSN
jgi:tol-pal system protein YbgF